MTIMAMNYLTMVHQLENDLYQKTGIQWKLAKILHKKQRYQYHSIIGLFYNTEKISDWIHFENKLYRQEILLPIRKRNEYCCIVKAHELNLDECQSNSVQRDYKIHLFNELIMEDICFRILYNNIEPYVYSCIEHDYLNIFDNCIIGDICNTNHFSNEFVHDFNKNHLLLNIDNTIVYRCMPYFGKYDLENIMELVKNSSSPINQPDNKISQNIMNIKTNKNISNKLFHQIVSLLDKLHSMNIYHRDLKLSNIILDFDYSTVWIIDFGYSCFIDKPYTNRIQEVCGSHYMFSPELYDIYHNNTTHTSIELYIAQEYWCLGVILYELTFWKNFPLDDEKRIVWNKTIKNKIWDNPLFKVLCHQNMNMRNLLTTKYLSNEQFLHPLISN